MRPAMAFHRAEALALQRRDEQHTGANLRNARRCSIDPLKLLALVGIDGHPTC